MFRLCPTRKYLQNPAAKWLQQMAPPRTRQVHKNPDGTKNQVTSRRNVVQTSRLRYLRGLWVVITHLDIHAYFCNSFWNTLDITQSVHEVDFTETEYFRKVNLNARVWTSGTLAIWLDRWNCLHPSYAWQGVKLLMKGCKCVTGCNTRCSCRRNDRQCECIKCTNILVNISVAFQLASA